MCRVLKKEKYSPLWQIGAYPCISDVENHIKQYNMYIALKENTIVSTMAVADHGSYSSLHLFAVHHRHRGQHIGSNMMKKMFEVAEKRGNEKILLDVVKGNLPAEKLYQKIGFQYVGERTEPVERVGNVCFSIYECKI